MNIKKLATVALALTIGATALAGCGSKTANGEKKKEVIKLGITGDDHRLWDTIKDRLAKDNIDLQIVSFSDYVRPNQALNDGEIDANAFQNVAYFEQFKKDHNLDLTSLGYTVFAPLGVYSKKIKDIKDLKDGGKIAIPNDATNEGRALLLLQSAGLIKLKDGTGIKPTVKDIVENSKKLEIVELVATQIPRSLEDVDAAVINSGVAIDAGFAPRKDSIFLESTKTEDAVNYYNLIAVRTKDKDKPALKKLIEVYQTDETKKEIEETTKGASIPVF